MIRLVIIFLAGFFYCLVTQSQAQDSFDKEVQSAAIDLCNCTVAIFTEIHPEIKNLMLNMQAKGQDEAHKIFEKFLLEASVETKTKIQQDIEKFKKTIEEEKFNDCIAAFDKKYKKAFENPDFQQKLEDYLYKSEDCKITYILMKIGQEKE